MDCEECRVNALTCYRLAQGLRDTNLRRDLLALMVQWRELAELIEETRRSRTGSAGIGLFVRRDYPSE